MSAHPSTDTAVDRYLDDDFKEWLLSLLQKHHVPGMSVAVVNAGKVEAAGYGYARLPSIPATGDTIYCMGSTTKAFTAALMGLLIREESKDVKKLPRKTKLDWTTPVSELLPDDFVTTDSYITKNTTIEDALSHRSGLAGHDLTWGPSMGDSSTITRSLRHLGRITAPFRGKFQYNNLMYAVIGQVIEVVSGRKYSELLEERIWRPLNMDRTYPGVHAASTALTQDDQLPFARGYYWVEDDQKSEKKDLPANTDKDKPNTGYYIPEAYIDLGALGPAGHNISTVKDYAKWVQAFLAASKPVSEDKDKDKDKVPNGEEDAIIPKALFVDLTTPRSVILPVTAFLSDIMPCPPNAHITPCLYSLGWMDNPFVAPGEQMIEHSGGLPGFGSNVSLLPNHDFGVVAVGNTSGSSNKLCEAISRELLGRKLGKSKEERRKHKDPEKKEQNADGLKNAEQVDTKDIPSANSADSEGVSPPQKPVDDKNIGLPGHYVQGAYGTYVLSRATDAARLDAEKPELEGTKIQRKKKQDGEPQKAISAPIFITPVPRRGLDYKLIMHNPRHAAGDSKTIIYALEMLLSHGNLSDDPFSNLEQEFPAEPDKNNPLRNEKLWESQKVDKNAAVVQLDANGKVESVGLQLFRVDMPEKTDDKPGDDELEDGWEDRLVWFKKERGQ